MSNQKKLTIDSFTDFEAIATSKNTTKGDLTIVYADTGKRIELSKNVLDTLNNPQEIKFKYNADLKLLAITSAEENGFKVKASKNKGIIYNASLIKEIIDKYSLNFEDKTSMSFSINADYQIDNTVIVSLES